MAQDGVPATRKHRAQQAAVRANLSVAKRVDAAPETLQALGLDSPLNCASAKPGIAQLSER